MSNVLVTIVRMRVPETHTARQHWGRREPNLFKLELMVRALGTRQLAATRIKYHLHPVVHSQHTQTITEYYKTLVPYRLPSSKAAALSRRGATSSEPPFIYARALFDPELIVTI